MFLLTEVLGRKSAMRHARRIPMRHAILFVRHPGLYGSIGSTSIAAGAAAPGAAAAGAAAGAATGAAAEEAPPAEPAAGSEAVNLRGAVKHRFTSSDGAQPVRAAACASRALTAA